MTRTSRLLGLPIALVAFIALASCGGATPRTTAPSTSDACWPVAPMRLFDLEHTPASEPVAELRSDGTIYVLENGSHGSRKVAGRVSNDVFVDVHDQRITCVHRQVTIAGGLTAHYDADDSLVFEEGKRMSVRDDGTITASGKPSGGRIEGPIVENRRTAILLVVAAMVSAPFMPEQR